MPRYLLLGLKIPKTICGIVLFGSPLNSEEYQTLITGHGRATNKQAVVQAESHARIEMSRDENELSRADIKVSQTTAYAASLL